MTAFVCGFVAWVLAYVPFFVSVRARAGLPGGYDNRHPREQTATLDGLARRAVAAHQNGLENFPAFAAAVLVAHLGHGHPALVSASAAAFVALRAIYIPLYLFDRSSPRSVVWMLGMAATGVLFLSPMLTPAS